MRIPVVILQLALFQRASAFDFSKMFDEGGFSIGLVSEIYCGLETCYDVLGLKRSKDFDVNKMRKIYRRMSMANHPDKFLSAKNNGEITAEQFETIEEKHRMLTTAYDTLKNNQTRFKYDHYLDNPEDRYYNHFEYYKSQIKVEYISSKLVILALIIAASVFQWLSWNNTEKNAFEWAIQQQNTRRQAKLIAIERGTLDADGKLPKNLRRRCKEPRKEVENIVRAVVKENVFVAGGKKTYMDLAIVQAVLLPKTLSFWVLAQINWYRRRVMKADYNDEEKWYLIKKYVEHESDRKFDDLKQRRGHQMLEMECWIKENAEAFNARVRKDFALSMNGKEKQKKRAARKMLVNGIDRMSFNENDAGLEP